MLRRRRSLAEIGREHAVVKAQKIGPQGETLADQYEPYLAPLRTRPIRLLELGIERANSLRMWRDYFARPTIVGLDAKPSTTKHARDFLHVHGPQEDPDALDRAIELLGGSATIIIDDCSHKRAPTEFALRHLWPTLEPGGFYFIEDIHVSWREKWAPTNPHGGLAGLVLECAKVMHVAPGALPGLRAIDIRWRLAVLHKAPDTKEQ